MNKRIYDYLEIKDLKDMLNKTEKSYANRPAYKIKIAEGKYQVYTHKEVRDMINALGKALINSVKGQTEDGLIFCGSNVSRIKEIVSVKDLMKELVCKL